MSEKKILNKSILEIEAYEYPGGVGIKVEPHESEDGLCYLKILDDGTDECLSFEIIKDSPLVENTSFEEGEEVKCLKILMSKDRLYHLSKLYLKSIDMSIKDYKVLLQKRNRLNEIQNEFNNFMDQMLADMFSKPDCLNDEIFQKEELHQFNQIAKDFLDFKINAK